jgi:hypothetical protein
MKKLIICLTTAMLLITLSSNQTMAASRPATTSTATLGESAVVDALIARLHEIKTMDKSTLSQVEKKEFRKEVRSTKEALRTHGHGGIYISGGAILVIILLIILL